jgi:hypothetical protein
MAAFFIPNVPRGELERTYKLIRTDTEALTGQATSARRISTLACRRGGTDYEAKVGSPDAVADRVVVAIFDLGHNEYAIRCASRSPAPAAGWSDPIVVRKHQVYSATEFAT